MDNDIMLKGVVAGINERGAKIDGDWYNYTKQEWRESPWHSPAIGDTVEVKLRGDFIRSIKLEQAAPATNGAAPRPRQFSSDSSSPRYLALKLAAENFGKALGAATPAELKGEVSNVLAVADDFYEYLTQQDGEV